MYTSVKIISQGFFNCLLIKVVLFFPTALFLIIFALPRHWFPGLLIVLCTLLCCVKCSQQIFGRTIQWTVFGLAKGHGTSIPAE